MINKQIPVTRKSLSKGFQACGIESGDTILVHSNLFVMGPVEGESGSILDTYYGALVDVIGDKGTLAVPAYFYEYGRYATPYDIKNSPVSSELGVFASFVTKQSKTLRSPNPLSAIAAVGKNAPYLCNGGTFSSFGVDSPWDRLVSANGKMLYIGVDLHAMTFIHYVEHMVGVPHLYNKLCVAPVLEDSRQITPFVCSQVKYLNYEINYDLSKLTPAFEHAGLLKTFELGRGKIRCVKAKSAFDFLKEKLKENYYYLLKSPPNFTQGKVPMDGSVGEPPSLV